MLSQLLVQERLGLISKKAEANECNNFLCFLFFFVFNFLFYLDALSKVVLGEGWECLAWNCYSQVIGWKIASNKLFNHSLR